MIMKLINNRAGTIGVKRLFLWLCILFVFAACKDENKDTNPAYVSQVQVTKNALNYLSENSTYGDVAGTYPASSKIIVDKAIAEIDELLAKIKNGSIPDEGTVKAAIERAHVAIDQFKDSRRINLNPAATALLERVELKSKSIKDMRDNTTYGNYEGNYPSLSKEILQKAVEKLDQLIERIKGGTMLTVGNEEINAALNDAEIEITKFKASVRIVDNISYELLVNGNSGGYIDFGYSDDYIKFGAQGNQAFTIELWVKIKDYCNLAGEDNSTFLSTYTTENSFYSGWRVQSRNKNIVRGSVGIVDVNNQNRMLWEPAFSYSNKDEWMHFVFIYSDKGLDGDADNRSKIYKNGNQTGDIIRIGEKERQYNAASAISKKMKMTAFTRLDANGNRLEYFNGSIKYMRIWKIAKTPGEIKLSYNRQNTIDPQDPDLVGAWDFRTKPAGQSDEIKDITGKHTAKLIGNYSWVESVE
ncbi:DUF4972 domain-containing protein [Pedobacter hiemivivus]|uniref:DUF4972 domain-containing protein n=2 Tax=Pedobacter hiemivivus TaxID=2530454 RepID=A0A4U1G493_9SPHI|nr:DUF4972 domain-containing protein [Pedobacter hiemivivus]